MANAYKAFVAACAFIAAACGLDQSYSYGLLGDFIAGEARPNCPTPEQIAERAAND